MDRGFGAAGVAQNVGKALLDDTEKGRFLLGRKARKPLLAFDLSRNSTSFRKTVDVPLKSGPETEFIEERRMEQVGERSDFVLHLAHELDGVGGGLLDVQ